MFSIKVRDHIMIAHSLPDPFFGPAKELHGATYVVDAEFTTKELNSKNVVMDIGKATDDLKKVLSRLAYKNLDDLPEFEGKLTTTEFLAKYIHGQLKDSIEGDFRGGLKVTLGESHVAWASYEGNID